MAYLVEALEELGRRAEGGQARKGRLFERLIRQVLDTHPGEYGKHRFRKVWMWADWPGNNGEPDHGIDLVGEQLDGSLCAVQCKFYALNGEIPASAVSDFIAASDSGFTSRIFVTTAEVSQKGWRYIDAASPRCEVLSVADMDGWVEDWREWLDRPDEAEVVWTKHTPRLDQEAALEDIAEGFKNSDRGKLILPCGTGKSVVAMWVAERMKECSAVLYLVPSISLMGQTMREWARNRSAPHLYLGVCSDKTSSRRSDNSGGHISELAMPVTTDAADLAEGFGELLSRVGDGLVVVFATYQSAKVVAEAQMKTGLVFDLVICDEAHRTTGLAAVDKLSAAEQSGFTMVHQPDRLLADKKLFMTATPRMYTEQAREKASQRAGLKGAGWDVDSYSMDDEELYGPVFHQMSFSDAIEADLLSDYEVLVIAVSDHPDRRVYDLEGSVPVENVMKLLGCWDALADPTTEGLEDGAERETGMTHPEHARTAIAFTNTVKVSKAVEEYWPMVVSNHTPNDERRGKFLELGVQHIDGSTSAVKRAVALKQLQGGIGEGECRVVTNAKVLTEGVDVPALDSIIFLEPRKSKIDITQAVGRVMRKAPGKSIGRVVIPVVVPEGLSVTDDQVLRGSDFKVVWDVVRALRSHDERIDYWINHPKTAAVKGKVKVKVLPGEGGGEQLPLPIVVDKIREQVASKLVEMCGDKKSWIVWGQRAAKVAARVRKHVGLAISESNVAQQQFDRLVEWSQATLNPQVTADEVEEMVAQHVVTMPIFDHMFEKSRFVSKNPVSVAIQNLLDVLDAGGRFESELAPLDRAYRSMRHAFDGAIGPAERVDVLRQVYEGFFHAAMRDAVDRLGIVYTPVEIVDFILRSADAVCKKEFGKGLGDEGVTVLDPFAGTGTFLYRLLTGVGSDGELLVPDANVWRKYHNDLYANEVVLLAYYIAALKIETAFAERLPRAPYQQFPGMVFCDTFLVSEEERQKQLAITGDQFGNSERALKQAKTEIQVIVANPPWSAGQKSAGDDNPNQDYEEVAERVRQTYGKRHREVTGRGAGGNAAGNLYVQAIRWATDRLDEREGGIIAIVHPNSLLNGTSLAGMRAALRDEFTSIYVVNLRGNAYTSGEEFLREGDQIFGPGSRNGVQITVLVRNPTKDQSEPAVLHYAEVPEGQSLKAKFTWLEGVGDATNGEQFATVPMNTSHDWVNLSDGSFNKLLAICDTDKNNQQVAFRSHASGIKTNLDSYVYAFSRDELVQKVKKLINTFNDASEDTYAELYTLEEVTVNKDLSRIKWTSQLKQSLKKAMRTGELLEFDESRIREVLYRPFLKKWLYEDYRILSAGRAVSGMFPIYDASPPPPPESSSPLHPTQPSSAHWPPTGSATSNQQESPQPAGTSPASPGDLDNRPLEHGGVQRSGGRQPGGSSPAGGGSADEGSVPASEPVTPPPPFILLNLTDQIPFGVLASNIIYDLCVTGRQTRGAPQWTARS